MPLPETVEKYRKHISGLEWWKRNKEGLAALETLLYAAEQHLLPERFEQILKGYYQFNNEWKRVCKHWKGRNEKIHGWYKGLHSQLDTPMKHIACLGFQEDLDQLLECPTIKKDLDDRFQLEEHSSILEAACMNGNMDVVIRLFKQWSSLRSRLEDSGRLEVSEKIFSIVSSCAPLVSKDLIQILDFLFFKLDYMGPYNEIDIYLRYLEYAYAVPDLLRWLLTEEFREDHGFPGGLILEVYSPLLELIVGQPDYHLRKTSLRILLDDLEVTPDRYETTSQLVICQFIASVHKEKERLRLGENTDQGKKQLDSNAVEILDMLLEKHEYSPQQCQHIFNIAVESQGAAFIPKLYTQLKGIDPLYRAEPASTSINAMNFIKHTLLENAINGPLVPDTIKQPLICFARDKDTVKALCKIGGARGLKKSDNIWSRVLANRPREEVELLLKESRKFRVVH